MSAQSDVSGCLLTLACVRLGGPERCPLNCSGKITECEVKALEVFSSPAAFGLEYLSGENVSRMSQTVCCPQEQKITADHSLSH